MCGITGVFAPGRDAARLAFFALYALQHRGQESAGIAAADGGTIRSHKEMGLLGAIFDEDILGELSGHIAIGHTRYSTTGSSIVVNAQPLLERTELGDFAFAHNGNLTNTDELRESLAPTTVLQASSDSEVMAKLIVESKGSMLERIESVLASAPGAYSIVLCTDRRNSTHFAIPGASGRSASGGSLRAATSSLPSPARSGRSARNTCARSSEGEIVRIGNDGLESTRRQIDRATPALCMFEYIYFARPDSKFNERSVYMARYEMGRKLAKEHPVDADVVMAVPDSAVAGGIGYATESGLPYIEGLIKNRYIGRTFISPDQRMRSRGVHLKFNPVVENLCDQRVVVVDDSIVRGTTTPRIVALLREAGATRSPFAHHVTADQASVLPRRRHGHLRRADRRELHRRRDSEKNRCRFAGLSESRWTHRRGRTQARRDVSRVSHRRISKRAGRASKARNARLSRAWQSVTQSAAAIWFKGLLPPIATVQMGDAWRKNRGATARIGLVAKRTRSPRRSESSDAVQDRGRTTSQSLDQRRRSHRASVGNDGGVSLRTSNGTICGFSSRPNKASMVLAVRPLGRKVGEAARDRVNAFITAALERAGARVRDVVR